jgi:hypothetical protein
MEPVGSEARQSIADLMEPGVMEPIRKGIDPYGTLRFLWTLMKIADQSRKAAAMEAVGRTRWAIAEGYIPSESSFSDRALISHETACILNATDRDAHVAITIFFANREPVGPYRLTVAARRTLHLRFNDLDDPRPIPRDTDYASVFESDVPIVVQHTRLDSRHAEVSLLSTMAYAAE